VEIVNQPALGKHPGQRQFAVDVVRKLRAAGHVAYWAGGCVRDQLLDCTPADYDVATSATPSQVRDVFGRRRTLKIGAAFGVITVLGPPRAGQIDVATFRRDEGYSDGRHPDAVTFSSPEEDAKRRDFTINGLFFDPLEDEIIDFVGGLDDLARRVIRAIGDPQARIEEDKLRLLRAVRFAITYNFEIESATLDAIARNSAKITVVSAERIAQELRRMLTHANRSRALDLLRGTGLLEAILPEAAALYDADDSGHGPWRQMLAVTGQLQKPNFPLALAAVLRSTGRVDPQDGCIRPSDARTDAAGAAIAQTVGQRWRLAKKETQRTVWLIQHQHDLDDAHRAPRSRTHRILIHSAAGQLLDLLEARDRAEGRLGQAAAFCRAELARPVAELNPPPLISGRDLLEHGVPAQQGFQHLLESVRDAQLDRQIHTRQEALDWVDQHQSRLPTDEDD
jgi:poly(A) polymerase